MDHIVCVRHAGVSVRDLEKSLHFYRDLLGLTIRTQADEKGPFLEEILGYPEVRVTTVKLGAAEGPTLVELLRYDLPKAEKNLGRDIYDFGASHVALTVRDVEALYKHLTAAGVVFRSPPRLSVDGRARVAFCEDPDGMPVELVEPC
jgi:catechol 2,3-dioxygenase-like lactoylglutathione lyase family enzyme